LTKNQVAFGGYSYGGYTLRPEHTTTKKVQSRRQRTEGREGLGTNRIQKRGLSLLEELFLVGGKPQDASKKEPGKKRIKTT